MEKLIITPKSKIFDILEAYPELEDVLVGYVPEFVKIKDPLLRRTVGKIATLQQAASIGAVPVAELVNHLRAQVGQQAEEIRAEETIYQYDVPAWFNITKIAQSFDVRETLERGEHPVAQVMEDLKKLKDDEIYQLIAPFLTVPLIDKATSLGFTHWVKHEEEGLFFIYFVKAA